MPTVTVPGQGDVEFPDSMSDDDIAAAIKTNLAPPPPEHGRLANAVHATAAYLPMAGGIVGGALGAGMGAPAGPGAIATGGAGALLLGSLGRVAQRGIDSALGYEKPPGILDATTDAAKTGLGEGAGAAGGAAAGEILGAVAKPLSAPLRALAQKTVGRILRNTGGSLSAAKPLSADAAQELLDMGIVKPFGSSSGTAARLQSAREAVGDQYGKIVKALEAQGITGPDAQALAEQYAAEGSSVAADSMNASVPGVYKTASEQLLAKPTTNGKLGLTQAENLKRSLQDQATSAYKQMQPGELARAHEDAASMMRQAVEDAISKQTAPMVVAPETKAIAAQFEPVKQQAGRLIEAAKLAQLGMNRAANRSAISLPDYVMAAGEGIPAGIASHFLRTRGPSTVATAANAAANALEDPASNLLTKLGAGAGSTAGQKLMDILEQLRKNRSEAQNVSQ